MMPEKNCIITGANSGMPSIMRKMYALKSKFAITPEEMAETYTYLATSPDVSQTTGAYYDDPDHIVLSSAYSRDPENIDRLMALTWSYLKNPQRNEL